MSKVLIQCVTLATGPVENFIHKSVLVDVDAVCVAEPPRHTKSLNGYPEYYFIELRFPGNYMKELYFKDEESANVAWGLICGEVPGKVEEPLEEMVFDIISHNGFGDTSKKIGVYLDARKLSWRRVVNPMIPQDNAIVLLAGKVVATSFEALVKSLDPELYNVLIGHSMVPVFQIRIGYKTVPEVITSKVMIESMGYSCEVINNCDLAPGQDYIIFHGNQSVGTTTLELMKYLRGLKP